MRGWGRARRTRNRVRAGLFGSAALFAAAMCATPAPAAAKTVVNPATDTALIAEYAGIEGGRLGIALPGGAGAFIQLKESPSKTIKTPIGPALGTTLCHDAVGGYAGPATGCVIELSVITHSNGELRDTIAHEVFHVFQAIMAGSLANYNRPGNDWLIEGSAQWVESDLNKSDRSARNEWKNYLRSPGTALFTRTYSAIGFFGHMASSGVSPWSRFKAMFAATSSAEAWAAGTGGEAGLLDSEASAFFLDPGLGSPWYEHDNNVPSRGEVGLKPTVVSVTSSGKLRALSVKPYTDGVYELSIGRLSVAEPVLEVRARSGFVRLRSTAGSHVDAVLEPEVMICGNTAKACRCPSHPSSLPEMTRGDLAITGASTGGAVELIRRKSCEELLKGVSCTTLLPGFSNELSEAAGHVVGRPSLGATVTSKEGNTASECGFLEKGYVNYGGEFVGVIAPLVSVLTASSIGGAAKYYEIITRGIPPGYVISHPAIGDEAQLLTQGPPAAEGYSSLAIVRVHNIVAQWALFGTPGNTEADPNESLRLLKVVAAKL